MSAYKGKGAIEIMNEAGHHLAVENLAHADYLIYEAGEKLRDEEIAALRSEIANYETARQEDARRLKQVTAERDAMREALQKIATTHRLDARLAGVAYGYQQIALAALKGGKG